MLNKLGPLIILAGAAQSYYNKSGKKKPKEILIDPKTGKEIKKKPKKEKKDE